jgi:hypothetical protein
MPRGIVGLGHDVAVFADDLVVPGRRPEMTSVGTDATLGRVGVAGRVDGGSRGELVSVAARAHELSRIRAVLTDIVARSTIAVAVAVGRVPVRWVPVVDQVGHPLVHRGVLSALVRRCVVRRNIPPLAIALVRIVFDARVRRRTPTDGRVATTREPTKHRQREDGEGE